MNCACIRVQLLASILFLLYSPNLFAQAGSTDGRTPGFPWMIEWEAVPGAGAYRVEIRDEEGEAQEPISLGADTPAVELSLPAGEYQFRIVTLNRFMTVANTTEWVSFVVEAMGPPRVRTWPGATVEQGQRVRLTLSATRVSTRARAELRSPSGARIRLSMSKQAGDNFWLSSPPLNEPGAYSLVMVNPPDYRVSRARVVRVNPPPAPEVIAEAPEAAPEPSKVAPEPPEAAPEPPEALLGDACEPEPALVVVPAPRIRYYPFAQVMPGLGLGFVIGSENASGATAFGLHESLRIFMTRVADFDLPVALSWGYGTELSMSWSGVPGGGGGFVARDGLFVGDLSILPSLMLSRRPFRGRLGLGPSLAFVPAPESIGESDAVSTVRLKGGLGARISAGFDFVFLPRLSASFDLRYLCVFDERIIHEVVALLSVGVQLPIGAPFLPETKEE